MKLTKHQSETLLWCLVDGLLIDVPTRERTKRDIRTVLDFMAELVSGEQAQAITSEFFNAKTYDLVEMFAISLSRLNLRQQHD